MSFVQIKCLKALIQQAEKIPGIQNRLQLFRNRYTFRVNFRIAEYSALISIAMKANAHHRKQNKEVCVRFGNSELKLFCWVVILYCHCKNSSLQQLGPIDFTKLNDIFKRLEYQKIMYEIKTFYYSKKDGVAPWIEDEISMLKQVIKESQEIEWKVVAFEIFKRSNGNYFRVSEEYREKWINYLRPTLLTGKWPLHEQIKLMRIVNNIGRKWALISREFSGTRNQHNIKNQFNKLYKFYNKGDKLKGKTDAQINEYILACLLAKEAKELSSKHQEVMERHDQKFDVKIEEDGAYIQSLESKKQELICPKEEDSFENKYIFYPTRDDGSPPLEDEPPNSLPKKEEEEEPGIIYYHFKDR